MLNIRGYIFLLLFTIFFLGFVNSGCSGKKNIYKDVPFNRITLIKNDTLFQFYTKPPGEKLISKFPQDIYYTWYRADSIHVTKGAYSGKLLHGDYMELYPDRSLKQKGKYKEGVKDGRWQSWFQNGERESIITWKYGLKNGKAEFYFEEGKLQRKIYKDGIIISDSIIYKDSIMISDSIINKKGK